MHLPLFDHVCSQKNIQLYVGVITGGWSCQLKLEKKQETLIQKECSWRRPAAGDRAQGMWATSCADSSDGCILF